MPAATKPTQPAGTGEVRLLCDLTPVVEYFRRTFQAEELWQMPQFVVSGTTPVFVGETCRVELDPGLDPFQPGIASRFHACRPRGASGSSERLADSV